MLTSRGPGLPPPRGWGNDAALDAVGLATARTRPRARREGPHILSIVWQVRNRLMHSPSASPADRASRPITCSCSFLRVVMRRLLMRLHSTFVSFAVCVSLTALARLPPVNRQESAQRKCLTPQTLSSKRSLSASMSIVSASCKSCSKRLGFPPASHGILFVRLGSRHAARGWRPVEAC